MAQVPNIRLNSGVEIPQFGFGVFQIDPDDVGPALGTAFEAGYRHVDTAQMYRNETEVGKAIAASGLRRDEVFVTTKLDNDRHGHDEAVAALGESLDRLGLDHVDLFLVHWPRPSEDRYVETWKGFEKLAADGRARAIGVSNFQVPHLQRVIDETGVVPSVNQVELHPNLTQEPLRAFHAEHGITTEAWSPLARGGLLEDPVVGKIAATHGRTAAQVILRWHLQLGNVVIPKSVTPSRIAENFDVFDFSLSDDDVAALSALDSDGRIGPHPDEFNAA